MISLETGEKRQLTHPAPPALGDMSPAASPDGSRLVFRRMAGLFVGELYVLPLGKGTTATGEARRLTEATLNAEYPAWMPDSREVLFSTRGSLWRLGVDDERPAARLPFVGEYGMMPAVSHDGANAVALTSMGAVAGYPHWSADGEHIAFHANAEGQWELYTIAASGGKPRRLTSHARQMTSPAFHGKASGSTSARIEPERSIRRSGKSLLPAEMLFS